MDDRAVPSSASGQEALILSARQELESLLQADAKSSADISVLSVPDADGARSYASVSSGASVAGSDAGSAASAPIAFAGAGASATGVSTASAAPRPTPASAPADVAALHAKLQALNDTNVSVMAQNVALTGDLETAHAMARELRNEKAALAAQLRAVLEQKR